MVKRSIILSAVLSLFFLIDPLQAYLSTLIIQKNAVLEEIEFGTIDWTAGTIIAQGTEPLMTVIKDKSDLRYQENPENYAFDSAEARKNTKLLSLKKAEKNFYNAVLNIRLKNNYFLKNYLTSSENNFKFLLNTFLEKNRKITIKYNQDNSITTEISIDLYNSKGLIQLFINDPEFLSLSLIKQTNIHPIITPQSNEFIPQAYTALIIDASEVAGLQPSLFPEVIDEDGQIIYNLNICSLPELSRTKYINYLTDLPTVRTIPFVDQNTYIIKALSSLNHTDLILPKKEITQFFSDQKTLLNLKKANVIIIFPVPRG